MVFREFLLSVYLLLVLSSFQVSRAEEEIDCGNIDVLGYKFDLSRLATSQGWDVKEAGSNVFFEMSYHINFCGRPTMMCHESGNKMVESMDLLGDEGAGCGVIGDPASTSYELLDVRHPSHGLKVIFADGDPCGASLGTEKKRTIAYIECAEAPDLNFAVYDSAAAGDVIYGTPPNAKCDVEFKIQSPAGCPLGVSVSDKTTSSSSSSSDSSISLFWKVIIFTIVVGAVYVLAGFWYNKKYNNLQGAEALPNREFWSEVPSNIRKGVMLSAGKARELSEDLRGKMNSSSSYDDI